MMVVYNSWSKFDGHREGLPLSGYICTCKNYNVLHETISYCFHGGMKKLTYDYKTHPMCIVSDLYYLQFLRYKI